MAADDRDHGQRRLVLDPQRPRRVDASSAAGRRPARGVRRAGRRRRPCRNCRRSTYEVARFSYGESRRSRISMPGHEHSHPGSGRHRQDRPPRGRAAAAQGIDGPHRLALGRRRLRLGRRARPGPPRSTASSAAYVSFYPDLALPGAAETIGAFARLAAAGRRQAARAAVRPRRARGPALRAGADRRRHRMDDRALQLVRAELQRGVHASTPCSPASWPLPAGAGPRAVRRRRGHRRGRGRRAHRGPPRRRGLRADRPARAALRRGRRPRSPPPPVARSASRRIPVEAFMAGMLEAGVPRTRPSSSPGCSPTCSTAATRTRRTASSARSAAPRATSASTPARRAATGVWA